MKKDQFIVVCAESAEDAGKLLPTAHFFAEKLRKGLILLSCSPCAEEWIERFNVPFVALKGDWKNAIDALPTAMNAVLAITLVDSKAPRRSLSHPRQLLKNFRDCKIAYLILQKEFQFSFFPSASQALSTAESKFIPANNIHFSTVLTIDHQRESKEKLIWASYMARFFGSTIRVMHRNYRDAAFKIRWTNNMRYLEKIFSSLNLSYETAVLEGGSEFGNPDLVAMKTLTRGASSDSLFLALVPDRRDRDIGDYFSKPDELHLIKNEAHLPVLLLNQRDDLYVLCD